MPVWGWIVISILLVLFLIMTHLFFAAVGKISRQEESEEFKRMIEDLKKKEDDSSWF